MISLAGHWKSVAALLAIFAAGMISGLGVAAGLAHWWLRPPRGKAAAAHMREHFERSLKLTEEQKRRVDPILEHTTETLASIRDDTTARINHILDESDGKILPALDAGQRKKLHAMQDHRRAFLQEPGPF